MNVLLLNFVSTRRRSKFKLCEDIKWCEGIKWCDDIMLFKKREKHRSLDDIRESIAQLRYYWDNMF